jgi:serine protease Do
MKIQRSLVPFLLLACLAAPSVMAQDQPGLLEEISNQQADLYEKVGPTVVLIQTIKATPDVRASRGGNPQIPFLFPFDLEDLPDDWQYQFVPKRGLPDQEDEPTEKIPRVFGLGSGIVVRADSTGAWILTNTHVLGGGAEEININFRNEIPIKELVLESDADAGDRNVFLDPKSDIAVIHLTPEQIGERQLVAATFGDSDALRVGEMVFTLGAPLNRDQTFSQGIVSAKERSNVFPGYNPQKEIRYEGLIQTTAFINQGNSGGPLLDIHGNVVGINVAIQTAGGFSNGFVGIGFAIPANRAKAVVDQLVSTGKVVRGWLGVGIEPPSVNEAVYFNLPAGTGVKLAQVYPDTPAAKGGLEANDILLSFNGQEVRSPNHLQDLVALYPVGEKAKIEVLRGGEKMTLDVEIGEQPDSPDLRVASSSGGEGASGNRFKELGATIRDLDADEAEYYGAMDLSGVIVEEIDPNGPLADKSIPKGSLITKVERTPVESAEQLRETLDGIEDGKIQSKKGLVMISYVANVGADHEERFAVVKLDF